MKSRCLSLIALGAAILLNCRSVFAADVLPPLPAFSAPGTNTTVTLVWYLTDATAVGSKIYQGTGSRNYSSVTNVGNVTTITLAVFRGTDLYFAATDYDINGIESPYSNEVFLPAYVAPPTFGLIFLQGSTNGVNWVDLTGTPYLRLTNGAGGPLPWQWFRSRTDMTTNWK